MPSLKSLISGGRQPKGPKHDRSTIEQLDHVTCLRRGGGISFLRQQPQRSNHSQGTSSALICGFHRNAFWPWPLTLPFSSNSPRRLDPAWPVHRRAPSSHGNERMDCRRGRCVIVSALPPAEHRFAIQRHRPREARVAWRLDLPNRADATLPYPRSFG